MQEGIPKNAKTIAKNTERVLTENRPSALNFCDAEDKENARQKIGFIFEKVLDFLTLLWYFCVH
jgi:hypothetical protein